MNDDEPERIFTQWLEQHGSTVVKVARAYTFNAADEEELTQEILMQCWRSLPQFDARSAITTWFYRVALNQAMNWKRRERSRKGGKQTFVDINDVVESAQSHERQIETRETIERLYRAIRSLAKSDAALVLLHLDEISYTDIAQILGMSPTHVGVKLHRVKKQLKSLMTGAQHGS